MKGIFSPSGTPIRPPTRECTRSALRMAHGGDVSPFTWTHAHAFPAPHGMPRPARRKGCSEMLRVPHETPRPKLPDFTCTYVRLHLCRNPGAAAVQVSPLACLVNKERAGLCAPKDVRRPGFGEGRERVCMQGRYSEKNGVQRHRQCGAPHGRHRHSRPSPCSRRTGAGKADCLAQRPSEGC